MAELCNRRLTFINCESFPKKVSVGALNKIMHTCCAIYSYIVFTAFQFKSEFQIGGGIEGGLDIIFFVSQQKHML